MPSVVANRKRVARVRGELHLGAFGQPTSRQFLMEDCANMRGRAIAWQVELDGDAFPMRVGVWCDEVAGNVAGENRDRIEADFGVVGAEAPGQRRREPAYKSVLHRLGAQCATNDVPHRAFLQWQMADIFREEVNFHTRMRAIREI